MGKLSLYFIRHGQTLLNADNTIIGGQSPAAILSEKGEIECQLLAKYLCDSGMSPDLIYSSPYVRTAKTAEKLCELLLYPVEDLFYTELIVELSQGLWEGRVRDEVYTTQTLLEMSTQGNFFTPPGGESKMDVVMRAGQFVQKEIIKPYLEDDSDQTIIVVTHGIFLKCLLYHILNFDSSFIFKTNIGNTSITKLEYDQNGFRLCYINSSPHIILNY